MGFVPTSPLGRMMLLGLLAAFLALGCGQKSNKQIVAQDTKKKSGNAAANDSSEAAGVGITEGAFACQSKEACPPADLDIYAPLSEQGSLLGIVGKDVDWEFEGFDHNTLTADQKSSTRKVVVLLNRVPTGSSIVPANDSGALGPSARVVWRPTSAESGQLDVIARDYERCVVNESADTCNSYNFLDQYDKKFSNLAWLTVDQSTAEQGIPTANAEKPATNAATVVNVSNPNCGPAPTTDIQGQLMGTFMNVLKPGGLMNVVPSMLGGMMNGNSGASGAPTQC